MIRSFRCALGRSPVSYQSIPRAVGILQLPPNATTSELRFRYLDLVKTLHPDKLPPGATPADKEYARAKFTAMMAEYEQRTAANAKGIAWAPGRDGERKEENFEDYQERFRKENESFESEQADYDVVFMYVRFKVYTAIAAAAIYVTVDSLLRNQLLDISSLRQQQQPSAVIARNTAVVTGRRAE